MTKIFLTGASGFIGSRLKPQLELLGHDVYFLSRPKSKLDTSKNSILGDLTDYDRIYQIIAELKPEVVYHLAALTPVRESFKQPMLYQQINYLGTINLVHACLENLGNNFRFIMASTAEVYGENGEDVKREGQKLVPMSPYAVSKAAADIYIQMCGTAFGLEYVLLRSNNTYGRPYSGYFVEAMMEKLMSNKLCDLYYPNNSRDYMWVDDHVNGYLTVLNKGFGVYNVAPGELITNIAMVRLMKKVIGSDSEIKAVDAPGTRPTDHRGINMDSGLIRNLGWEPKTSRVEGIKKLYDMYKQRV
jgi:nucleoside-diphosphate-sugar epimerase